MIALKNITKRYGETVVLENTSYVFPQKGLVCLMGPSGGGKTTLLNLIAGFDTDYDGELSVGNTMLTGLSADALSAYRRDCVGFIFQNYHLLPGYSALENVLLAAEPSGEDENTAAKQADVLLDRLGLVEKTNQRGETLSGGQKQRVAIARALMGNPQLLLADEPTGALDRQTSAEIMDLLKEISQDRLVVVITHDEKLLPFADEVLHIENRKLVSEQVEHHEEVAASIPVSEKRPQKAHPSKRAAKNFRIHQKRYLAIALAISIGLTAFLLSLSFGNVTQQSIADFQQKNTAFQNGYIKGTDDGTVLGFLAEDERIEHAFYQYKLSDVSLSLGEKIVHMDEKYPLAKAGESLSYGVMPRRGKNEIALSPSLAKKLDANLPALLGKDLRVNVNGQGYTLTVSGIYNASHDDFFVSSDVEEQFYTDMGGTDNYSISYDVKEFKDIVAVSNRLALHKISLQNASKEVFQLQQTFQSLQRLFLIISVLLLLTSLLLCALLIFRLQNTRYREIGLLSALGFRRKEISSIIRNENALLSGLAAVLNALLLGLTALVCRVIGFPLSLGVAQVIGSSVAAFVALLAIGSAASFRLLRTEPAEALQK